MLTHSLINNSNKLTEINGNYKVVNIISSGYVINCNNKKILLKSKIVLNLDDLINVKSTNLESLKEKKEQYDYYLKSLGINYISNKSDILKINKKTSIRSIITNYLLSGPNFYVKYISLILMGKKNDLNKELYEKAKYISILHLFVISGFHINLLMIILLWIGKKLKIKSTYMSLVGFVIITLYLYLLGFPLSGLRAFIFLFLLFINKRFLNNKFSKINILSSIMLLMFIINPFIVFSLSFIFTFAITFAILFVSNIRNKKIKITMIVLFSYLSSAMLSTYINGWVNIFGILNSVIFSPLIIINYIAAILFFPFKEALNYYFIFVDNILNIFYNNSLILKVTVNQNYLDLYYLFLFSTLVIIRHQTLKNRMINNRIIYKKIL